MKRIPGLAPVLILASAAVALLPAASFAQEEGYAFRLSNFSLELFGGWSKLDPSDFNALADVENAYLKYYFVTRFGYYQILYGEGYRATSVRTGDAQFNPITGGRTYGFRVRYAVSPSLALSLGVQGLDRERRSSVGLTVGVTDAGGMAPNEGAAGVYAYKNSGFLLGVSAWAPVIAAHFGWQLGPVLRLEALIGGGPVFLSCHAVADREESVTGASGAISGSRAVLDMKGSATSFTGELGVRLNVRTGKILDLFVEGAFTFREGSELIGPGSSWTQAADSKGARDPVASSWTGTWGTLRDQVIAPWGTLTTFSPQNRIPAGYLESVGKFALNLSGLQARAGLAVRL